MLGIFLSLLISEIISFYPYTYYNNPPLVFFYLNELNEPEQENNYYY